MGGPTPGTRIGAAPSVSKAYTEDLNMRFRNDAVMMSDKDTVKRIERQDILTILVIAVACITVILLLFLLP